MVITEPFEEHVDRYEEWFEHNQAAYRSELRAIDQLLPDRGPQLEVGVGSGRFGEPLGIEYGVDPAWNMLGRAQDRGIGVAAGVAERLPVNSNAVRDVLNVTTICFVEDLEATLAESARVLDPDGRLVIGFVDRESPLGQLYQEKQDENPFYRDASFHSTAELTAAMEAAGFEDIQYRQTLFENPQDLTGPEEPRTGYGEGSFVVIAGTPT